MLNISGWCTWVIPLSTSTSCALKSAIGSYLEH